MSVDPQPPATEWLARLSRAFDSRDVDVFVDLFLSDGWLRDSLVFSWDVRSLKGHDKIGAYIKDKLPTSTLSKVVLDERRHYAPTSSTVLPGVNDIEFAFTFENSTIRGIGHVRLLPQPESEGSTTWKALSVYMAVDELKGHEEMPQELGIYEGHTLSWSEVSSKRRSGIESDPQVIIVGAGQTGMMIAARFKQMQIKTLIIDKSTRVGDVWRQRYPSLTLHTPRTHHQFLYAPFPTNWPTFTPRDKLASWMEQYAETQDLAIWLSSYIASPPSYDMASKKWTVSISHDGFPMVLHPSHIIVATGTLSSARIPTFTDRQLFKGDSFHSTSYEGGHSFANKRVIVIGAGNTAPDLCQDLHFHGASEVTMIQRSKSCVWSIDLMAMLFSLSWPEGVPTEVGDLKSASMPAGLLKELCIKQKDFFVEFDREMHEALKKGNLNVSYGPDDAGVVLQSIQYAGGFWIDVGCAKLIGEGKVKVKSGVEIDRFTESGLLFKDGTKLDADVIILATGYHNIRENARGIFGDELIDQTSPVWGMDDDTELRGCYRPSGQPGLWFAAGDFYYSRYRSRQLGLLIKADELGLRDSGKSAAEC